MKVCMNKVFISIAICCLVTGIRTASAKETESEISVLSTQQKKNITGTVLDAKTNEPVISATIQVKGTTTGVVTDIDGKFNITCMPNNILVVSFIGYIPQEIKVGKSTAYMIRLEEDAEVLDEVVVTAFGAGQKKESIVGSIQTVRPADLKVPSSNLSTSFAGRLSGVVAYQRSGQPGSNSADFFIRGVSTLSGITSPLIILDGVEVSSADLNSLDPEIIEGFSILKDATATAMYGTRGANGVMIVTTKSGADLERPIIGFRIEGNVSAPTKVPKFVDGARYMEMFNEAITNQGTGDVMFTNEQIYGTRNNLNPYVFPNVDWYDEIFKDLAFNQKANFNIRGGTKKITYFMNIGVNHETGMLKNRTADLFSYNNNIDLKKYAFQNNIDFHMSRTSTISLHLNVQLNDMTSPNTSVGDIYSSIMNSNPVDFPVSYPGDGTSNWIKWGAYAGGNDQGASNPMALFTNGYKSLFESTVLANIDFNQKLDFITEGLRFKALFSYKNWNKTETFRGQGYNRYTLNSYNKNEDGTYSYEISPMGNPTKPTLSTASNVYGDRRIYAQAYLDYTRSFGDHHVNGMALWNLDQYDNNVPGSDLIQSLPRRKMGIAGRLSYDYAHRYMIEVNAGYNGSENFAAGNRWGFFPSIAIGWNIAQENFFKPATHIFSNLKLRGSFGLVGNDQITQDGSLVRFIYLSDINLQNTADFTTGYGNNKVSYKGPTYNRYQNNAITWEVGKKLNVGMDLQLFNSVNFTIDGFQEIRQDIFQQKKSIPNYLGTAGTVVYGNLAKVKNWGFDASIDYGKQLNRDLSIQFKGTFTFARNKVLEYDEAPGLRPALSQVGKKLNTYYGYITDKLYIDYADIANSPSSTLGNISIAPGDIKYVDQPDVDGTYDGKITSDDRVPLGFPTVPEIVYGFGPSIQWKKWDFSFFFQGVANTSLMMSGFHPFGTQYNRNVLQFVADDYWSETNQNINAQYPRLTKYNNDHNNQTSDFWLRNAAFLKLKNAEIGYSFRNMRIYLSGTNLLTFSPFKYWDPEMGGGKGLSYPTQRVYNIGFQMTFK